MSLALLEPADSTLVLVDQQAGLVYGERTQDCRELLGNAVALARTARVFELPIVASTSAIRANSGPLMPALQRAVPDLVAIGRRSMNAWKDPSVRTAIAATGRRRLIVSGMLTEACVSFLALSAAEEGYDVFVVGDACGGLTPHSHDLALRRMQAAGIRLTSWLQVLLELHSGATAAEAPATARAASRTIPDGPSPGLPAT